MILGKYWSRMWLAIVATMVVAAIIALILFGLQIWKVAEGQASQSSHLSANSERLSRMYLLDLWSDGDVVIAVGEHCGAYIKKFTSHDWVPLAGVDCEGNESTITGILKIEDGETYVLFGQHQLLYECRSSTNKCQRLSFSSKSSTVWTDAATFDEGIILVGTEGNVELWQKEQGSELERVNQVTIHDDIGMPLHLNGVVEARPSLAWITGEFGALVSVGVVSGSLKVETTCKLDSGTIFGIKLSGKTALAYGHGGKIFFRDVSDDTVPTCTWGAARVPENSPVTTATLSPYGLFLGTLGGKIYYIRNEEYKDTEQTFMPYREEERAINAIEVIDNTVLLGTASGYREITREVP